MAVSMATTSVPRWPHRTLSDIEFDAHATHHLVFATDLDATEHIESQTSLLPEHATVVDVSGAANPDELVAVALAGAMVGWRFVVVGTGAPVMRTRALIIAAGAIDDEIAVVHVGGEDGFAAMERDVFCSHCHAVTPTASQIDQMVTCSGCDAELVVYYHFSRRHSAYLGFRPDSEELTEGENAE